MRKENNSKSVECPHLVMAMERRSETGVRWMGRAKKLFVAGSLRNRKSSFRYAPDVFRESITDEQIILILVFTHKDIPLVRGFEEDSEQRTHEGVRLGVANTEFSNT